MKNFFHLHLISDATGETLNTISKSVTVQFPSAQPIEHFYALVRTDKQLARVLQEIETSPGIVFFTIIDADLRKSLEDACKHLKVPAIAVLDQTFVSLRTYLGAESITRIGGQHRTNKDYFDRIEAVTFTMAHDDGQNINNLDTADVILVGVSRTTKTPTSIYLANRGFRTANVPMVKDVPLPEKLFRLEKPLIICLVSSPDYIVSIRKNRLKTLNVKNETPYIDKQSVIQEIRKCREIAEKNNWPIIDVTRRSIEETAATVLNLYHEKKTKRHAG